MLVSVKIYEETGSREDFYPASEFLLEMADDTDLDEFEDQLDTHLQNRADYEYRQWWPVIAVTEIEQGGLLTLFEKFAQEHEDEDEDDDADG